MGAGASHESTIRGERSRRRNVFSRNGKAGRRSSKPEDKNCANTGRHDLLDEDELDEDDLHLSTHSLVQEIVDKMVQDDFEINNVGVEIRTLQNINIDSLYDGVHDGPILGYGIGGPVRLVTHKVTGTEYAVKFLSTDKVESEEGLVQLREEIGILIQIDHPNIVKLEGVYESDNEIYLVQELCRGGDLFDRLDAQPKEHYTEGKCAHLVKQILSSVRYLHSKGIVHRDLKLENFLFENAGVDSELKLIDFGLSKHFKSGDIHHEPVGTRYTVAPEVLKGSYDEGVDVWAIGVITFLLLSGDSPFGGCGEYDRPLAEVKSNILNANYSFEPEEIWDNTSSEAKDFISSILVVDPNHRLSAEQCQGSSWLQKWTGKEGSSLSPNVIHSLRAFSQYSELRKILCEVIGFTLLPQQIVGLRREFMKLDVEQTGQVSLDNLKKVLLDNASSGSLGDFTEKEVEDIFNSLRKRKQTHIQWHEFIAAELSQCAVEERNHKIAFDRLDTKGKGYITCEDFVSFVGPALRRRQHSLRGLWNDSLEYENDDHKINFEEFKKLMTQTIREGDNI